MRLIRRGICRDVLLVGRWAVKVPTFRYGLWSWTRGYLANHAEWQWSNPPHRPPPEVFEGVAPCVFSIGKGLLNVYPRCEPVTSCPDYDDDEGWGAISGGVCWWGDRKAENLGLLNGRVVWVDYDTSWNGCPHTPRAHEDNAGA